MKNLKIGSEKQIDFARSIIDEFNELVDADTKKQALRIEKMIAKGKNPDDFIARNAENNYWFNMIAAIVRDCDDAAKIIDSKSEIINSAKRGTSSAWANIAFLVGGMTRTEINSDKYNFTEGI